MYNSDIKELFKTFNKDDFYNKINLHIHSNISDGVSDFDNIVERAKSFNMKYISITDHNSIEGYKTSKYVNDDNILIKGVEFDCFYKMSLLHILGYGIDIDNLGLSSICAKTPRGRKDDLYRLLKMRHPKTVIEKIRSAGGIAVLAHPCCINCFSLYKFVSDLKSMGLDGIEAYYPYDRFRGVLKFHKRETVHLIADKLDLIKTGGSDEHNEFSIIYTKK